MRLLRALLGQLLLLPLVAVASFLLVAALPAPIPEAARTQEQQVAAVARYREELGVGALGVLRPWQRLARGERLGATGQGVDGATILRKLGTSVRIGALALLFALPLALGFALANAALTRRREVPLREGVSAVVLGTPVFLPAMLLAPSVIARGEPWETLVSAALLSVWPATVLGSLLAEDLAAQLGAEYVRAARARGLTELQAALRHALPNVLPTLLDAVRPTATTVLAGSFALERAFALHGFGELYVRAVVDRQPSVVVVCTTLFAGLLVAVGVLVDALRWLVDPRARDGGRS